MVNQAIQSLPGEVKKIEALIQSLRDAHTQLMALDFGPWQLRYPASVPTKNDAFSLPDAASHQEVAVDFAAGRQAAAQQQEAVFSACRTLITKLKTELAALDELIGKLGGKLSGLAQLKNVATSSVKNEVLPKLNDILGDLQKVENFLSRDGQSCRSFNTAVTPVLGQASGLAGKAVVETATQRKNMESKLSLPAAQQPAFKKQFATFQQLYQQSLLKWHEILQSLLSGVQQTGSSMATIQMALTNWRRDWLAAADKIGKAADGNDQPALTAALSSLDAASVAAAWQQAGPELNTGLTKTVSGLDALMGM